MALGYPHPDYLLRVLNSRQISEWQAWFAIEPFGQYPEYLRAGIIAATIANVHKGKKGRSLKAEDFIPKEPEIREPKRQSMAEIKKVLQQIAKGGKKKPVKRKKKEK